MNNLVVMKFGGTSVGSPERMSAVARRVAAAKSAGQSVVVVVSAMSGETDRLIALGKTVAGEEISGREYHALVASGEQVSAALVAMALERTGVRAASMLAPQLELRTEARGGHNLIQEMNVDRVRALLAEGITPVVAGFQGIDESGAYTTLGRGGSDTTAVALAAALDSCRCEILTDVDGVYTALPTICPKARKLKHLTYEEMLELSSGGAKVLQVRSVALAYKYRVPLFVLSSFNEVEGTEIVEAYQGMEDMLVSGITCRSDQAKLTVRNLEDKPGIAARVFRALGEAEVVVDMIVQSQGQAGKAAMSMTVPLESVAAAEKTLNDLVRSEMGGASVEVDRNVAKLSVVGEGMRTHAGVASKMFEVLGREGINVEMITTSEIKISVCIQGKYAELAQRVLHEAFIEGPK